MKKKVFVACKLEDVGLKKLKAHPDLDIVVIPKPTPEELKATIADSEAIIIKSNVKLTEDILEAANKMKIICRAGAGVDNVDVKKATQKGIPVTNTPGLNSNSVAEQVFSYIHVLYKNMNAYDRTTKEGLWEKGKFPINELRGKTIGVAGVGAIGRRVLEKAKGYRMNAKVYDPFITKTMAEDMGADLVTTIEELFTTCDIVTLHMPATNETKCSVTKELLCRMKDGAVFINTARGNLCAPNALEEALAAHQTLRAGVDVFAEEKAGEKPLAKFGDRVVMTPHIAGNSLEGQLDIAELAADMIIQALTENKLRFLVNFVKIPEDLSQAYLDLAEELGKTAATLGETGGQLEEIRVTCYDKLHDFAEILAKPAIKGVLSPLVEDSVTLINADALAKDNGVKVVTREPDNSKGYGKSITVDIVMKKGSTSTETSVRGKLIEMKPEIVRINQFQELNVKPVGNLVFFVYDDRPGVIGRIATSLGQNSINIEGIWARKEQEGSRQMLVIRTEQTVSSEMIASVQKETEAALKLKIQLCRSIHFS